MLIIVPDLEALHPHAVFWSCIRGIQKYAIVEILQRWNVDEVLSSCNRTLGVLDSSAEFLPAQLLIGCPGRY